MLAKLLKHDYKNTSGLLGILSLAALGLSIPAIFALRIIASTVNTSLSGQEPSGGMILMTVGMLFLLMGLIFALCLYGAAASLVPLYRFYKSRFTDEGYLTFTLPAKPWEIFLSSYLTTLGWSLVSILVICAVVILSVLFGPVSSGVINPGVFKGLDIFLEAFTLVLEQTGSFWSLIAVYIISFFTAPLLSMVCLVSGAVLAKKHKLLAAFGVYYALSNVLSMITGIFSFIATIFNNSPTALSISYLFTALLHLVLGVGSYFLSVWLMKHKLNLP